MITFLGQPADIIGPEAAMLVAVAGPEGQSDLTKHV